MSNATDENAKLRHHLSLLREEYVKLQNRVADLERDKDIASFGSPSEGGFLAGLMQTVSSLYNSETYSDLLIRLKDETLHAHKIVFAARSNKWCSSEDLSEISELDLSGEKPDVVTALIRWVYIDKLNLSASDDFLLDLMRTATKFHLPALKKRCEQALLSSVTVRNCISFYQTATEIGAETLEKHCSDLISTYWSSFTSDDFSSMPAPLLYTMSKAKSEFPLHAAIRLEREDVVFLYLIEFDRQIPERLDELDKNGDLPLELALSSHQFAIADTLISHKADVNRRLSGDKTILHCAIEKGNVKSAEYLLEHGASPSLVTDQGISPLHLAASFNPTYASDELVSSMARITQKLLDCNADPNVRSTSGNQNTPLHCAILSNNTEVFDTLLKCGRINLEPVDAYGQTPLWLALQNISDDKEDSDDASRRSKSFALKLVQHGASPDATSVQTGNCLLHLAARSGNEAAGLFLVEHNANTNMCNNEGETPLHISSSTGLHELTIALLRAGANPNVQTIPPNGFSTTGLSHSAISTSARLSKEKAPLAQLHSSVARETRKSTTNKTGIPVSKAKPVSSNPFDETVSGSKNPFDDDAEDTNNNASTNPFDEEDGAENNSFSEKSSNNPFDDDGTNNDKANPFSDSCNDENRIKSIPPFTSIAPGGSLNPGTAGTQFSDDQHSLTNSDETLDSGAGSIYRQTPLHLAVVNRQILVVQTYLNFRRECQRGVDPKLIAPDFALKNSAGQSVFGLAVTSGLHDIAIQLLQAGADVNETDVDGYTLLHQAVFVQDTKSAQFLIAHGASVSTCTPDGRSPLQLAISRHLPSIVDRLCGADGGDAINALDEDGDCPLWQALDSGQEDIASILVRYGCNRDVWGTGPVGCQQTLLHRAIDENKEHVACFLIRSGCDVNSPRRPGPNGEGEEEAHDQQGPLHLASSWGLDLVVQELIEHNANINAQDKNGRTPLHLAIMNSQSSVTPLLLSHPGLNLSLRDREGYTAFATAMLASNEKAAENIIAREPSAADQRDNRGRNFLHIAIQKNDLRSVLFLISIHADVNSPIRDGRNWTPLHMAVEGSAEIIVRNLLLAGATVNTFTSLKQSPLHIAAEKNCAAIASVLIESGVPVNALDVDNNNALHVAIQHSNLPVVKVLAGESPIDINAVNSRGMNVLHMLGQYGRENAAEIFECLQRHRTGSLQLDCPDMDGNTALLRAYMNGNGKLCRSLVYAGACIAIENRQGISIFNFQVPTRQLLCRLLDVIPRELPWADSDHCMGCTIKFGLTTRKHHCRHCGRVMCNKCTERDIPIVKFKFDKPVRVCELCFTFLSTGTI